MEVSIDEECSRILATRAPAAGDLRMVVATIKAITDLERIGDECEKIGLIAARLATVERPADRYREVKHLGRTVQLIVHDTLDSFARLDSELALKTALSSKDAQEFLAFQQSLLQPAADTATSASMTRRVVRRIAASCPLGPGAHNVPTAIPCLAACRSLRSHGCSATNPRSPRPSGRRAGWWPSPKQPVPSASPRSPSSVIAGRWWSRAPPAPMPASCTTISCSTCPTATWCSSPRGRPCRSSA